MRRSFGGNLPLWIGAVALPGLLVLVAVLPNATAESTATGAVSGHSAKSQTRCESDGPEQGDIHKIVLRDRGDRPGVKATFSVKGAAPDTRWDYEVSVTAGGSELVKTGSKRTGGRGNISFSLINSTPGRAFAESGLSPHDGSQYCTMSLTAMV